MSAVEAVDAGDAVADRQHGADFGNHCEPGIEIHDLVADYAEVPPASVTPPVPNGAPEVWVLARNALAHQVVAA